MLLTFCTLNLAIVGVAADVVLCAWINFGVAWIFPFSVFAFCFYRLFLLSFFSFSFLFFSYLFQQKSVTLNCHSYMKSMALSHSCMCLRIIIILVLLSLALINNFCCQMFVCSTADLLVRRETRRSCLHIAMSCCNILSFHSRVASAAAAVVATVLFYYFNLYVVYAFFALFIYFKSM